MKITGIGIAVSTGEEPIPWPLRDSVQSRRYRPAASLREMVHYALTECVARGPIVLASCNGKVTTWEDTDWRTSFELADIVDEVATQVAAERAELIAAGRIVSRPELENLPPAKVLGRAVASVQCASGMHALHIARSLLAAGHPEVTVLAVDIASGPAHDNFEALRVLTDDPAPYTAESTGFQLGEAAVALRLSHEGGGRSGVVGPILGHDLDGDDALDRTLRIALKYKLEIAQGLLRADPDSEEPQLVVGQGAGPVEMDRLELEGITRHIALEVPIVTALPNAGHTLGASSLLSVAVAATRTVGSGADEFTRTLARRLLVPVVRDGGKGSVVERSVDIDGRGLGAVQALDARHADVGPPRTFDGRRMGVPSMTWRSAVVCRALGGACGAVIVGDVVESSAPVKGLEWGPRSEPPPLRESTLRQIAAEVDANRPEHPPDLVVVTLDCPLPPAMRVGQRILPTSVLEMTPGFIPQLVARAWGFRGPALCLVGTDPEPLLAALRTTHAHLYRLAIRGMHERHVEWIPRG